MHLNDKQVSDILDVQCLYEFIEVIGCTSYMKEIGLLLETLLSGTCRALHEPEFQGQCSHVGSKEYYRRQC